MSMGSNSATRPSLDTPKRPADRSHFGPYNALHGKDPRSSSAQSLAPSPAEREDGGRRTLLVVYIHGFMGNDTSFQSFPAHVHKYLKLALADTHVIHSKVYPRYKTYKAIEVARDNFSTWLQPHESATTDVILVGHSMGGLLAADVVLMPATDARSPSPFKHNILGTVNLDAPLLGLHPGIIISGISSLFRPKADAPQPYGDSAAASGATSPDPAHSASPPLPPPPSALRHESTFDPNFNPSFPNDVRLEDRGWWKNMVHFVKKHSSEGLVDATTHHLTSHLEFGSCLMDLSGLKVRYANLRRLEDVDDVENRGKPHAPPRVRFIQYYTVCHGYPKKPSASKNDDSTVEGTELQRLGSHATAPSTSNIAAREYDTAPTRGQPSTSDGYFKPELTSPAESELSSADVMDCLEVIDPQPMDDEEFHTPAGSPWRGPPSSSTPVPEANTTTDDAVAPAAQPATASPDAPGVGSIADAMADPISQSPTVAVPTPSGVADELARFTLDLPQIPDVPVKPVAPDTSHLADKDAQKQAEKEAKRQQKAYDQAVKDRDKAIKERNKIVDKRRKKSAAEAAKREKEAQKQEKEAAKQRKKSEAAAPTTDAAVGEPGPAPEASVLSPSAETPSRSSLQGPVRRVSPSHVQGASEAWMDTTPELSLSTPDGVRGKSNEVDQAPKPKKERKFCTLPDKINGEVDPRWVKVFIKDVDETAAHTSLFFPGPHYEKLVGDVSNEIVSWVQENATTKAIIEIS